MAKKVIHFKTKRAEYWSLVGEILFIEDTQASLRRTHRELVYKLPEEVPK